MGSPLSSTVAASQHPRRKHFDPEKTLLETSIYSDCEDSCETARYEFGFR